MKRPSFQFYPQDWLADPNVVVMTAEERGAYIQLLAHMWNTDDCCLPHDIDYLAKLASVDNVVITKLLGCYNVVENTIRHKRLDEEREKQDDYRSKCSAAGKLGMKRRWHTKKTATASPSHKVVITQDNSSFSSSSSSKNPPNPPQADLVAINKMTKWFKSMADVSDPHQLATSYLAKYGATAAQKALKNSTCTDRNQFSKLLELYSKFK